MNESGPAGGHGRAAPVAASVIIPAHQAAGFVRAAIHSALAQTRRDIEVIVVDDGSPDSTWDVIAACAAEDARVVPLRQPRRAGPAAARNAAIARARGRWLAVLDADDLYLPDRLMHMVAEAEALGADLLADNLLQVDFATCEVLGTRFCDAALDSRERISLVEAVRRDMPGRGSGAEMFGFFQPLVRHDFVRAHGIRYAEDVSVGEDFLFYFECLARGARFHLMPAAHYVQRVRSGSHSARRDAMLHLSAANRRMLRIAARSRDPELTELLRRRQRGIDIDCFAQLLDLGRIRDALKYTHCGGPIDLLRHVRAAAGALRRRLRTRRTPPGLPPQRVGGRPLAVTDTHDQGPGTDLPAGITPDARAGLASRARALSRTGASSAAALAGILVC